MGNAAPRRLVRGKTHDGETCILKALGDLSVQGLLGLPVMVGAVDVDQCLIFGVGKIGDAC